MIPALISGIVMGSLLLRLTAWERLQSKLHWVLPLGPVPHWSVAVLRLWPVHVQRGLFPLLWLLMLCWSVLWISVPMRVRVLSWLLKPCSRVVHVVLLFPLFKRLQQV